MSIFREKLILFGFLSGVSGGDVLRYPKLIVYSILANLVVEWLRDFEVKKNLVKFDIKELFLLDSI